MDRLRCAGFQRSSGNSRRLGPSASRSAAPTIRTLTGTNLMKTKTAVVASKRKAIPAYKNPSLPSARRVKDLLSRMTLEEKAAQMMCVWQEKAETLVDADGNFDLAKAKKAFKDRRGLGQVGRPSDAGGGKNARAHGGAHQRHPEVLPREQPPRHSRHLPRGVPARPRRARRHQLPAAHRARRHLQSRAGRAALHHDRARGPPARRAPGADAGGRCGPRAALGPRGRDLRRRSVPGLAHGHRRRARLPGRRHFPRQAPRHRHAEALRRPRPAGIRHELRARPTSPMRVLRETFLFTFKEALREGRRHQRHGLLQRDRRRSLARQQVAAARRAAQGDGASRASSSPTTTPSGSSATAPTRTATSSPRTRRKPARSRSRPASTSSCPIPTATCTWSNWSARACSKNRSSTSWSRPCSSGNSRWACSTIPTSIPTRPIASSAATRIASWRCTPRTKPSRC